MASHELKVAELNLLSKHTRYVPEGESSEEVLAFRKCSEVLEATVIVFGRYPARAFGRPMCKRRHP